MTKAGAITRSVVIEREMPHPPERVWRALTQGALIEEWLMGNDFQPVVGHRFNFRAVPMPHWNGVVDCQVLVVEPYQRLSYSWNASGEEATGGLKSVVTWTLTPTKGGVLVRIEQLASSLKTRPTIRAQTMAGSGTSAAWSGWLQGSAENEADHPLSSTTRDVALGARRPDHRRVVLRVFRTRGDTLIFLIVGTGFATAIIAGLGEIVFGHSGVPLPASLMIYPTLSRTSYLRCSLSALSFCTFLACPITNSSKKTDRSAGCPSGNVCQIPRLRPKQPPPTL